MEKVKGSEYFPKALYLTFIVGLRIVCDANLCSCYTTEMTTVCLCKLNCAHQVYVVAGTAYGLEAELGDLEDCARAIGGATSDLELSYLEEQVATASAQVQQSDLQVCVQVWISSVSHTAHSDSIHNILLCYRRNLKWIKLRLAWPKQNTP